MPHSEDRSTFVEAVRDGLRPHMVRVSQRELARRTGIAQPNIGRYLRGENVIGAENLHALADTLGLEIRVRVVRRRGARAEPTGPKASPE